MLCRMSGGGGGRWREKCLHIARDFDYKDSLPSVLNPTELACAETDMDIDGLLV